MNIVVRFGPSTDIALQAYDDDGKAICIPWWDHLKTVLSNNPSPIVGHGRCSKLCQQPRHEGIRVYEIKVSDVPNLMVVKTAVFDLDPFVFKRCDALTLPMLCLVSHKSERCSIKSCLSKANFFFVNMSRTRATCSIREILLRTLLRFEGS